MTPFSTKSFRNVWPQPAIGAIPAGVKRKMSNFPLRPRGRQTLPRIDTRSLPAILLVFSAGVLGFRNSP